MLAEPQLTAPLSVASDEIRIAQEQVLAPSAAAPQSPLPSSLPTSPPHGGRPPLPQASGVTTRTMAPPTALDADRAARTVTGGAGRLTRREERSRGRAKLRIYLVYLRAFGSWAFLCAWVLVNLATAALNPGQSVFLKTWLDEMVTLGPPSWPGLSHFLIAAAIASHIIDSRAATASLSAVSCPRSRVSCCS